MNPIGVADVRDMLAHVPDTDRAIVIFAIVIFAVDEEGGCILRRSGLSERATAHLLRAMADELDADIAAAAGEVTLQ